LASGNHGAHTYVALDNYKQFNVKVYLNSNVNIVYTYVQSLTIVRHIYTNVFFISYNINIFFIWTFQVQDQKMFLNGNCTLIWV